MKRISVFILAIIIGFTFVSCGDELTNKGEISVYLPEYEDVLSKSFSIPGDVDSEIYMYTKEFLPSINALKKGNIKVNDKYKKNICGKTVEFKISALNENNQIELVGYDSDNSYYVRIVYDSKNHLHILSFIESNLYEIEESRYVWTVTHAENITLHDNGSGKIESLTLKSDVLIFTGEASATVKLSGVTVEQIVSVDVLFHSKANKKASLISYPQYSDPDQYNTITAILDRLNQVYIDVNKPEKLVSFIEGVFEEGIASNAGPTSLFGVSSESNEKSDFVSYYDNNDPEGNYNKAVDYIRNTLRISEQEWDLPAFKDIVNPNII